MIESIVMFLASPMLPCYSLFDGDGGGAAQGGASTTTAVSSDIPVYGGNEGGEAPSTQTTSDTVEDRQKAYRDFIKEYSDIHTAEMQRAINRRFKETKALQERVDGSQEILDLLGQRYGVTDGDMGRLTKALKEDHAYWQEAADEAGMTVEQYMRVQELERQNRAFIQAEKAKKGREAAEKQVAAWYKEAEAVKARFPGFDLNAEVKNPEFVKLLQTGIPVEHAYKLLHMDEITANLMTTTARATENAVVANIRAKGSRPAENGAAAKAGSVLRVDVTKLTAEDRRKYAEKAKRGEKVTFS